MIGRIGRLTAGEFIKIFSQPFLYITLVVVLAAIGLADFLLHELGRASNPLEAHTAGSPRFARSACLALTRS